MSTSTATRPGVADLAAALTTRAAIYVRISDDKAGQGLGVERQREDCLALVERNGWQLVDVFDDNDISAFSGKPRPGYLAMNERIAAGEVDVVVAWHPDRLHRNLAELVTWVPMLNEARATVATVTGGDYKLETPDGRMTAYLAGIIAARESEHKRERVRRTMRQNAELGKAHGQTRTYGLRGERLATGGHSWEIVEDEAAVIREAAERVLSGEAMLAIVRDLNRREILSAKGKAWSVSALRTILLSARIAGWTSHTPGRTRDEGAPWAGGPFTAPAEWPAIVDRSTVERMRRILADPSRRRGSSGRTYLLSGGLAVCAACGHNLVGKPDGERRAYVCNPKGSVSGRGCGRLHIKAEALESYVIESVREAHATGRFDVEVRDAGTAVEPASDVWAEIERLRAKRKQLAEDEANDLIDREEWLARRAILDRRLDEAERDLARRQESESSALLVGGAEEFATRWAEDEASGNLGRMRARLSAAVLSVKVGRVIVNGRNTFDPDRVEIEWRA